MLSNAEQQIGVGGEGPVGLGGENLEIIGALPQGIHGRDNLAVIVHGGSLCRDA